MKSIKCLVPILTALGCILIAGCASSSGDTSGIDTATKTLRGVLWIAGATIALVLLCAVVAGLKESGQSWRKIFRRAIGLVLLLAGLALTVHIFRWVTGSYGGSASEARYLEQTHSVSHNYGAASYYGGKAESLQKAEASQLLFGIGLIVVLVGGGAMLTFKK